MLLRANQHSGPTMDSDDDNAMHMVNNCDSIAIFDAFHGGTLVQILHRKIDNK